VASSKHGVWSLEPSFTIELVNIIRFSSHPLGCVRVIAEAAKNMQRLTIRFVVAFLTFAIGITVNKSITIVKHVENQTSTERREAEEYVVYSAIINSWRTLDHKTLLVIEDQTSAFFPDCDMLGKEVCA
jgi:hypothetical protein